jgi:hypothetical protein
MAVYSKRLGSIDTSTAGFHTLGTTPTGKVWIVRDAEFFAISGGATQAGLYDSAAGCNFAYQYATGSLQSFSWRGRAVLSAGQAIACYVASGRWQIVVYGYELDA